MNNLIEAIDHEIDNTVSVIKNKINNSKSELRGNLGSLEAAKDVKRELLKLTGALKEFYYLTQNTVSDNAEVDVFHDKDFIRKATEFIIKTRSVGSEVDIDEFTSLERYHNDVIEFKLLVAQQSRILSDIQKSNLTKYGNIEADINVSYAKIKRIADEIVKEYSVVQELKSRYKNNEEDVRSLESEYRQRITSIEIDRDNLELNLSLIKQCTEKAEKFLSVENKLMSEFAEMQTKIQSYESAVEKMTGFISDHESHYEAVKNKIDNILEDAENILGTATTAGIGRHFKAQYDEELKAFGGIWWIVGGGICIILSVAICLLSAFPDVIGIQHGGEVSYVIARLLIAPIFILSAWFCVSQYIKKRTIIADYAHKKVLALSLLSIKDAIEQSDKENTTSFIKGLLIELLKSPLESLNTKHYKRESALLQKMAGKMVSNIKKEIKKKSYNK